MSKYTTEVRYICERAAGYGHSTGYADVKSVIQKAIPKVFDFDFPIFDENYRGTLETKILRHYYTREISEETVALWKLRLEDKLNLIMPYYNQLYKSELLEFNPFYDVDLTRDHNKQNDGTHIGETTEDFTGKQNDVVNKVGTEDYTEEVTENGTIDKTISGITEGTTKVVGNKTGKDTTESQTDGETHDTTVLEGTTKTSANSSTTKSDQTLNMYSDTPQGAVTGIFAADSNYLTNATKNNVDGKTSTQDSGTSENNSTSTSDGTSGQHTTSVTDSVENTTTDTTNNGTNSGTENTVSKNVKNTVGHVDTTEKTVADSTTKNDTLTNSKNTINDIETYIEHVVGKQGTASYSSMLQEFRDTFLNIDLMIIYELSDLFFNIW